MRKYNKINKLQAKRRNAQISRHVGLSAAKAAFCDAYSHQIPLEFTSVLFSDIYIKLVDNRSRQSKCATDNRGVLQSQNRISIAYANVGFVVPITKIGSAKSMPTDENLAR